MKHGTLVAVELDCISGECMASVMWLGCGQAHIEKGLSLFRGNQDIIFRPEIEGPPAQVKRCACGYDGEQQPYHQGEPIY
ncbi:MAG: hypothetical protein PHI97_18560 [Desulfobulbus sp.]|nr:hypothetical protein [Desulfobulbus sp.]